MGLNPGYLLKSYLLNLTKLLENSNSTSEKISTWCVLVVVRDLVRTKAYFVWRPSFAFSTYPTSWQALRSLALRGLHCLTFKPYGVKFSMKSQLKSLKILFHTFFKASKAKARLLVITSASSFVRPSSFFCVFFTLFIFVKLYCKYWCYFKLESELLGTLEKVSLKR